MMHYLPNNKGKEQRKSLSIHFFSGIVKTWYLIVFMRDSPENDEDIY